MTTPLQIHTPRLLLRRLREDDRGFLAEMNADPEVMAHLLGPLPREESDQMADRITRHWETHGFGAWIVEAPGVAPFLGFAGIVVPRFEAPFMPTVEILWRFVRAAWGKGFATEAARAALDDGFARLGLSEVVSFTVPANERSWRVMERLGMRRGDDFDHPQVAEGHRLRRHVLYRITRDDWRARQP
jgi:RimJ/RimL family protein N-acetyltransferase